MAESSQNNYIIKGDDLGAFGATWLKINLKEGCIPVGETITKAKIKIGNLPSIAFENPTFPLMINLSSAQTSQLQQQNNIFMAVWDSMGRKATCKGTISFVAKNSIVS